MDEFSSGKNTSLFDIIGDLSEKGYTAKDINKFLKDTSRKQTSGLSDIALSSNDIASVTPNEVSAARSSVPSSGFFDPKGPNVMSSPNTKDLLSSFSSPEAMPPQFSPLNKPEAIRHQLGLFDQPKETPVPGYKKALKDIDADIIKERPYENIQKSSIANSSSKFDTLADLEKAAATRRETELPADVLSGLKKARLYSTPGAVDPVTRLLEKYPALAEGASSIGKGASKFSGLLSYLNPLADVAAVYQGAKDFSEESDKDVDSMEPDDKVKHYLKQTGNVGITTGGVAGLTGLAASAIPYAGATLASGATMAAAPLMLGGLGVKLLADSEGNPEMRDAMADTAFAEVGRDNPGESKPDAIPLTKEELAALSGPNSSQYVKPETPKTEEAPVAKTDDEEFEDDSDLIGGTTDPEARKKLLETQASLHEQSSNPQEEMLRRTIASQQGFTNNTVENLKAAQEEARQANATQMMLEGIAKMTGGALGLGSNSVPKVDKDAFKGIGEAGDQKVKDFVAQTEKEKDDAGSAYSNQMRDIARTELAQAGFDPKIINDKMSASQIAALNPTFASMMKHKDDMDLKRELAKQHSEELKFKYKVLDANKQEKQQIHEEEAADKEMLHFGDQIAKADNSRMSNIGKAKSIVNQADRLFQLTGHDESKFDKLSEGQIYELIGGMDSLINTQSTVSGREHLAKTFESLKSKLMGFARYGSNAPVGRQAGDFVKQLYETIKRERGVGEEQLKGYYNSLKSNLSDKTLKLRGDKAERMVTAWADSLAHKMFYDDATESGIRAVMNKNNVSREKAIKALQDAGKIK